jgi:predicted nucleic acid-binding protein
VILLDTSVLSRAFRRRSPGLEELRVRAVVEELLAGEIALGLPGIVLQEVLTGIRSETQFAELEDRLVASFSIVSAGAADHVEAARLANRCQAAGLSASGPDCLIAVLAIEGRHELFAIDDDFRTIAKHAPLKLFEPKGIRTAG